LAMKRLAVAALFGVLLISSSTYGSFIKDASRGSRQKIPDTELRASLCRSRPHNARRESERKGLRNRPHTCLQAQESFEDFGFTADDLNTLAVQITAEKTCPVENEIRSEKDSVDLKELSIDDVLERGIENGSSLPVPLFRKFLGFMKIKGYRDEAIKLIQSVLASPPPKEQAEVATAIEEYFGASFVSLPDHLAQADIYLDPGWMRALVYEPRNYLNIYYLLTATLAVLGLVVQKQGNVYLGRMIWAFIVALHMNLRFS
jgi:hypothetical protein